MKRHILWLSIFFFLQSIALFAEINPTNQNKSSEQNTGRRRADGIHSLGFDINTYFFSRRDELLSPLTYTGVNFGGTLLYKYQNPRFLHMLSVNVVAGKPKTSVELNYAYPNVEGGYDEYESDPFYLKGEAGYSCSISILKNDLLKQKERMFNLYVGGLFNFYMDYLSSSSIGWISAFSLNLNIFGELKLRNGSKITLHVFTPFIAYLSRPAWSVYNNEIIDASSESYSRIIFLGDFTSLNGLGRITAILNYEFILTKRISLDVGYEFSFVPSPVPRPIKTVVNNLNCGLTYHFQGR